jgi:diguanylate cyclase (GGDEF)-like protein
MRELVTEVIAALLFLAVAIPLALPALSAGRVQPGLALLLVTCYVVVSRTIKFPLGRGSVAPSYLGLVPMLLLLPPSTVPLLAAAGLVLGSLGRVLAGRSRPERVLYSAGDGWHALGPAAVLCGAGSVHGLARPGVYLAAFLAGCVIDLVASSLRESCAHGIAPRLQARVVLLVCLFDACIAPIGLLVAQAAGRDLAGLLFLVPLCGVLTLGNRDRSARIAEAHRRLRLVAHERTRLQAAVGRLGDAFTAKLDLRALTDVVLHGAIDALDADAGRLLVHTHDGVLVNVAAGDGEFMPLLEKAGEQVEHDQFAHQLQIREDWALALPFALGAEGRGALIVARRGRAFREDERALLAGLVDRAENASIEILAHKALQAQAMTDPLTGLGNRRKLSEDLGDRLQGDLDGPIMLMMFDLDGFKLYNDTFGHLAGDALLGRLGNKLATAVLPRGTAYRLGGDEFCVLLPAQSDELEQTVAAAFAALEERGETFEVTASAGTVLVPHEATSAEYALQLADERMYAHKTGRRSGASQQACDVLVHIVETAKPDLAAHSSGVARLAVPVGRRLGMSAGELDELARSAVLHDVGKVGLPEAILTKQGPLDPEEWSFIRQHTILGERILSASPALRGIATIVRASHERWDGEGYPDRLHGEQIPLAARIIFVCDAYEAITSDRCYRRARSSDEACTELSREAGRQFDPAVVTAFLEVLDQPDSQAQARDAMRNDQHARLTTELVSHVRDLLEARAA